MHITMLESRWVSPDGWAVRYLQADYCYDLPALCSHWLLAMGYAQRSV